MYVCICTHTHTRTRARAHTHTHTHLAEVTQPVDTRRERVLQRCLASATAWLTEEHPPPPAPAPALHPCFIALLKDSIRRPARTLFYDFRFLK
jgi:bacterioferritin-associated ferredoxin